MSKIMEMLSTLQAGASEPAAAADGHPGGVSPEGPRPAAASFVEHFNLEENPFADAVNLDYYFRSARQEEAFLRMAGTVRDGISLGLVTGPSGSGKTIVSQLLLQNLDAERNRVLLVLATPQTGRTALLREILREAGVADLPARSRELLELLTAKILELHGEGKRLTVLIDEAHFLESEALHVLRTLSNLETPREKLCTCLLFAEERFERRLEHPIHRSLATRMYQRIRLGPLSEEEVAQYLRFRLMVAGGIPEIFGEDALRAIFAASGGICRAVNRLAYLALEAGWRHGRQRVTADLIEGA